MLIGDTHMQVGAHPLASLVEGAPPTWMGGVQFVVQTLCYPTEDCSKRCRFSKRWGGWKSRSRGHEGSHICELRPAKELLKSLLRYNVEFTIIISNITGLIQPARQVHSTSAGASYEPLPTVVMQIFMNCMYLVHQTAPLSGVSHPPLARPFRQPSFGWSA